MQHIVIIGNGVTGTTAARHIRKRSDDRVTMISSETDHFFSRTALMYIYMGHMTYEDTKPYEDWFWEQNRIGLLRDYVTEVDTESKKLFLHSHGSLCYDVLVLATGAKSNKFGWPGQDLEGVQGLYSYPDLVSMEKYTKGIERAVIVGGGLIGIEMAEMLLSRNISVTFLVREENFWNGVLPKKEAKMIDRHILEHHIDLWLETELDKILSDKNGRARAVLTKEGKEISCQFVGLTAGVHPNIDLVKENEMIETDKGILIDTHFRTSAPDVYSGGDCAQFRDPLPGRRPVEQVWYTGKMHGEHIAANICGESLAYSPGVWFNSAKFLDIEYQTYGVVEAELPEDQETLYWEHTNGKKCVRINYLEKDRTVVGVNLFGIRGRHIVWEQWIAEKRSLKEVLRDLGAMNFDPEFFRRFERDIITLYNEKYPDMKIELKTQKGLFSQKLRQLLKI